MSNVIHLIVTHLFTAKCHNLTKLPNQEERNDAKHVGITLRILPAHFAALIVDALRHDPEQSDRKLLNEIKLLHSFRRDQWVRRAMEEMNAVIEGALPIDQFRACGLPKTETFVESQWPRT